MTVCFPRSCYHQGSVRGEGVRRQPPRGLAWLMTPGAHARRSLFVCRHLSQLAPAFVIAQLTGAFAATLLFRWLVPGLPQAADRVVVPHENSRKEPSHAHRDL